MKEEEERNSHWLRCLCVSLTVRGAHMKDELILGEPWTKLGIDNRLMFSPWIWKNWVTYCRPLTLSTSLNFHSSFVDSLISETCRIRLHSLTTHHKENICVMCWLANQVFCIIIASEASLCRCQSRPPRILPLILHFPSPGVLVAHFEKLDRQLRREFMFDRVTGLLLLFPTCLLHVVEVSSGSFSQTSQHLWTSAVTRLCPPVVQRCPAVRPEEHATPRRQVTQHCHLTCAVGYVFFHIDAIFGFFYTVLQNSSMLTGGIMFVSL